jgi:histidine triad (HIT) family protein
LPSFLRFLKYKINTIPAMMITPPIMMIREILSEITEANSGIVAHIFAKIPQIAKSCGLENGYRVISNCGEDAGQTVHHLHFHVLGGTKMGEKIL